MPGSTEGSSTLRLAVVGLYMLLLVCLVQTVIVLHLYATRNVDTTISASLILTFVSSQLSLLFVFLHSMLARRHKLSLMYNTPRTRWNSFCRFLPRILIMLWMVAAAAGIIVAARQPKCMTGHAMQNFWQIGLSCQLHRAVVGMTVVAFVSICTVFCCIEISNRPYQASVFGIFEFDQDNPCLKPSISGLSWSSSSTLDSLKREKRYHYRPTDLESLSSDRAFWIQRRNSLSSQSAIYPPNLRYSSTGALASPSNFIPQIQYSPSYRSASSSSTTTPSPSALGIFNSSLPPTRAGSTLSSVSRSTSSTSTRKSPLSTMRRASEPEVPIIPAKFLDARNKPQLQRSPTLPCSWSPSLTHAPLSADPAIRAFSTDGETPPQRPVTRGASSGRKASINGIRFVEPWLDLNISLQISSVPPQLPVRARGHSIPAPSATSPASAATYSTCPRISATPTSSATSSLHIPRTRPSLASVQAKGNGSERPELAHHSSSAYSNRSISSTLSMDFATCNILEAQRVKRRWELARSRDASTYGMGSWRSVPGAGKEPITSMRRARGRGKEKKRACTAS